MWAFIYIKSLKSYFNINSDDITDYKYEKIGHQSYKFSKRVFLCKLNNQKYYCQILVVADTEEEVDEYVTKKRPVLPTLNVSDIPTIDNDDSEDDQDSQDNDDSEDDQDDNEEDEIANELADAKLQRKQDKLIKNQASAKTMTDIVQIYQKTLQQPNKPSCSGLVSSKGTSSNGKSPLEYSSSDKNKESSDEDDDSINDEEAITASNAIKVGRKIPLQENTESNQFPTNHNDGHQTFVTDKDLQNALAEEKKKRVRAEKAAKFLNDKLTQQKRKSAEHQQEQDAEQAELAVKKLKRSINAYPTIKNLNSDITANKAGVENAYEQKEASLFCIGMMYATWGYRALAERCVKKTIKTRHLQLLSPRKKSAVKKHFDHMLAFYHRDSSIISYYKGRFNNYANRAINGAKKHMDVVNKYPELDTENDPDQETIFL
ncbi:SAGA-associated factor 73-like isoform X2 [Trichogramma pretiosum]|uniref:SAGA-associated factor 73-like isoform X2 n=1 Tax=Trichogramma pretiosum TaxID=7493 RepID=UPI000C71B15F|nr:SAGA-associated factor 73-like isoform X2 [Trichogramma pretiosum]XP_023317620.1 SAGA-associated factor 73-like isoform X2 [Trichogramma pretiosum]